ncbi:MAG: hypothetical protein JRG89_23225 [Deltaproteobacteria bacterium]|nr:hypothetical protein [Deltaproteobacteria bacterium]
MNVLATLLWLEYKRTAWVAYGTLVGLALYALVLLSLPAVVTGLDVLNLPVAGTPTEDCQPPDCEPSGQSRVEMRRESNGGNSSFNWSFSKTWGEEQAVDSQSGSPTQDEAMGVPSGTEIPVPEELQLAFRPRQALTAAAILVLTGVMLLGFWISHYREADRGEMVMLYQSPVSGQTQLSLRFLYMSAAATAVLGAVLAIYWLVQTSQSLAPLAPLAEGFGGRVSIHWGSLALATLATHIVPNVGFILLFIQIHNAYDLLGGQRLAGLVITLAALSLSVSAFAWAAVDPESSSAVLRLVSIESTPTLDSMASDFEPGRYRIDMPMSVIAMGAGVSFLMLACSTRIWREVEWS